MKKLLVSVLAAMMVCSLTACGGGSTAGGSNVGGLSEEELAKQEEEALKELEEAAKQEAMKEMEEALKQEEEAKKEEALKQEAAASTTEAETEPQTEVDPEAVLNEALPTILPIPEGEYEYGYQWSDRFNRVDYYTIQYNTTVSYETFLNYMMAMVEDGFEDPGKGDWSEENGETYFLSRSEGKITAVRMNWKSTGEGDQGILTFEIYVNERMKK